MERLAESYNRVLERIASAARRSGREPEDVRMVVVTKGHHLERIQEAVAAGAHWLGENYVEESIPKIYALAEDKSLSWHMIGHIQSRKAADIAKYFDWVQAVDSLKIAARLNRFCAEADRVLPVLLEFNMSGEESKFGWSAKDETSWDRLLPEIESIVQLENVKVRGLMTMAPYFAEPELARPYFRKLRELRNYLNNHVAGVYLVELSMGMSADLEPAIEEGATIVRVGQAIMGPREIRD